MSCSLPDACENESREESLLAAQNGEDGRHWIVRILYRDRIIIGACLVLAILMNFDTGRYVLYPFLLFATWVHEMSHGTAAILMGGSIEKLEIYHDGGGICWYDVEYVNWKQAFVSSAGYTGTAFWGGILLLYRRTVLGPTIGCIAFGVTIVLSCLLYVRNVFGFVVLSIEGVILILSGWLLPAVWIDNLFAFLAANCSMNAIIDIRNLYGSAQNYNGDHLMDTDAQAVAEYWGMNYKFWATIWLIFAVVMTLAGLIFARDARNLTNSSPFRLAGTEHLSSKQDTTANYWAQVM